MKHADRPPRRHFLRRATALVLAGAAAPVLASVPAAEPQDAPRGARRLAFHHTHTGERLAVVYAIGDAYLPDALGALNHLLRDHYSGDVGPISPALFDQLHKVQQVLGSAQPFQVISGYRSPATNARLRQTRGGGVARRSLHLEGRAIDVRLPDVALSDLHDAALSLRAGGVGYYPDQRFVHLDDGRVRRW